MAVRTGRCVTQLSFSRRGTSLSEHENPGEATVLVLGGRVRLAAAGESMEGGKGDLLVVPPARHSLEALADATILLTVVKQS